VTLPETPSTGLQPKANSAGADPGFYKGRCPIQLKRVQRSSVEGAEGVESVPPSQKIFVFLTSKW